MVPGWQVAGWRTSYMSLLLLTVMVALCGASPGQPSLRRAGFGALSTRFFESPKNKVIIGCVAGGVVIIAVVVALVICILCYYRKWCCFSRRSVYRLEKKPLISGSRPPDAKYSSVAPYGVEVRSRRSHPERSVAEEMRRQKEEQEHRDRDNAKYAVEFYLRGDDRYKMVEYLPDMGSRMCKYWFKIEDKDRKMHLLTIGPVSQRCPLTLDMPTLSTFNKLVTLLSHPQLFQVEEVGFISGRDQVLIIQPVCRAGSLKDAIYKSSYSTEWTMKYSRRSRGLETKRVALYGRQILEGLLYLYSHGFPPLGHVQTGNIFVDGDVCKLGGYENTLLGYKTRSYKQCRNHVDSIDLILFGHVVFEMSCGFELTILMPREQDYATVKDKRVLGVLQAIFDRDNDGNFTTNIGEVYKLPFFQEVVLPIQEGAREDHAHIPRDVRNLLAKVVKDKPRSQRPSTSSYSKRRRRRSSRGSAYPVTAPPSSMPTMSYTPSKPGATDVPKATPTQVDHKASVFSSSCPPTGSNSTKSRSAVLESIRGPKQTLRKTVTDDRSAPRI